MSEDPLYGVDSAVFENFKANLKTDKNKTLKRFISLQAQGPSSAKKRYCGDKKVIKKLFYCF